MSESLLAPEPASVARTSRPWEDGDLQTDATYRLLFERNPVPMWVRDIETSRFLAVNEAAVATYGFTREEFLSMTVLDIRPPEEAARLKTYLNREMDRHMISGTWQHRRKNGSLITVDIVSHGLVYNGRKARLVLATDVTERAQTEEALRASEARFQWVAQASSDAIWDWDLSTNRVWWSESFYARFGYDQADVEPDISSWTRRIHPDERNSIVASIHNTLEGDGQIWTAEYRFKRKDGSYALVRDRGHSLRNAAGEAVRMVSGMTDITEHRKLEAQFLRAQRMESIGTLAGGIAHDLNNVLAPILMSIELLKLNSSDPQALRLLSTIETSATRGAALVRQVLSFARGLDGRHVPVRCEGLLSDVLKICEETFPRCLRIQISQAKKLWMIFGDATQLHQVLLNLLVNARDAMPDGGILRVSGENIQLEADSPALHNAAKPGAFVLITISDTGTGIAPENLSRIFEPFFTTKEVGRGTGLGLATAHAIVKSHGGFIDVQSEVGKGTAFRLYLPADIRMDIDDATPTTSELPHGDGECVLLIDDEPSILHITQQTLEAFGYRVLAAANGADGVALYAEQKNHVAVVVTDMLMPIMDGRATIVALRRINPNVRIIAASGVAEAASGVQPLQNGVSRYLAKPYTAESLLRTLRAALEGTPKSRRASNRSRT